MTDKQAKFVEEYLVDLNAAAAARRAGYAGNAARLMGSPEVRRAIQIRIDRRAQGAAVRQEQVLAELGNLAFGAASDESGAKVKLASKLRALELLGKHLGLFEGRGGSLEPVVLVDDVADREQERERTPQEGCPYG